MGAKADPTVINAITKLESGVGSIGRTDLSLLSTGNATTIIRFIAITSEAKIKGMELTINSIAETVSTSLLTTRGLAITPESIVKWVYFDWPNRKLAEWLQRASELESSFAAGESSASDNVLAFDAETGQFTTAKKKASKTVAIKTVGQVRKCIANMQYAFTFFYREHWILPYFAALNSFIDEVDAETGSSITSVNFMIDKLLATEKSLILRALADGHPLSELRPFGGYQKFDRDMMPQLRAVHNKYTEKKVSAFSGQINALEARLAKIRTATDTPPAKKQPAKKQPKRPGTPVPKTPTAKKIKPEPRAPKLTGLAAKRLEVAKSMGFNSVGRAVSDWARKRREAGEPIACFWKSVGAEHGGPVECTNPTCPACVPSSAPR